MTMLSDSNNRVFCIRLQHVMTGVTGKVGKNGGVRTIEWFRTWIEMLKNRNKLDKRDVAFTLLIKTLCMQQI